MSGVMNEIFSSGDDIEITVTGSRGSKKSKFVKRGSTVTIDDSEALVAPFDCPIPCKDGKNMRKSEFVQRKQLWV